MIKLSTIEKNIGYPEEWPDNSRDYEVTDNLLENIIKISKIDTEKSIENIIAHKDYWGFSVLDVNAYYNPQDNSINFPAAVLEYELYSKDNSYYENLGSLDFEKFKELQKEVIAYYNKYKINGKLTVGENIADLGGLSCVVEIAKNKGASNEELKELFEAYAHIWASKCTDEYLTLTSLDTHAPDKIRVNAVLSAIDQFYEVYNITEEDEMFKPEDERPKIW